MTQIWGQLRNSCSSYRCHGASLTYKGCFYSLVFALMTSASIAQDTGKAIPGKSVTGLR
jgi:hypothetical protein